MKKYRSVQTVYHASENLSYLDAKMWNSIFAVQKLESSLRTFKEHIKLWKPLHCACRLCKTCVNGAGFLQVSNYSSKMFLLSHFLRFYYVDVIGILGLVRQNIRYLVFIFLNFTLCLCILLMYIRILIVFIIVQLGC